MTVGGDGLVSAGMKLRFIQSSVNRSDSTTVRRGVPLEAFWGEKRIRPGEVFSVFFQFSSEWGHQCYRTDAGLIASLGNSAHSFLWV